MNTSKLENLEAIILIAIIMINNIILNFPKSIIISTGSAAWINTLFICTIAIIFSLLIAKLFKNFPNSDILDISHYLGGNCLKLIIGLLSIVFFTVTSVLVIRNFSETIKIIYFNTSPIIYLILFFIIATCIANKFGIKVISKVTLIIAPIIFISILLILFSSFDRFIPQRLLPILGYGLNKTFFSGLSNLFGFTGLTILFFLKPLLKKQNTFKKISLISLVLSSIYLLLSVMCLLLVFPFIIETNESISIYLLSRMTRYGEIIQRANAIFILIWILSVLCFISIMTFFVLHIINKFIHLENINSINYSFSTILLGCTLIIQNYAEYIVFIETVFKYFVLAYIFGINTLILIMANVKYKLLNTA